MNTLLGWQCVEARPGRRRIEQKERKNDRRGEAHRTPPIYHPDSFRPLPRREGDGADEDSKEGDRNGVEG
ncbi:hypothetical protein PBY51_020340 [Eleginops maclovinus]|uniref:Uncharacterized protein n=1 Tax=Eleginops maclovinus TaxID=56733 RepID=A0AAN8AKL2_ELEMC|nr:hypothetical protein PBY51_020340 [Eleginops maclovinus]